MVRVGGRRYPIALSDTDVTVDEDVFNMPFGSAHPTGICHFARCDGSVGPISPNIDTIVLGNLANRDDGELVSSDAIN